MGADPWIAGADRGSRKDAEARPDGPLLHRELVAMAGSQDHRRYAVRRLCASQRLLRRECCHTHFDRPEKRGPRGDSAFIVHPNVQAYATSRDDANRAAPRTESTSGSGGLAPPMPI